MINIEKLREYRKEQEEIKEAVEHIAPLLEEYVQNLDGSAYYEEAKNIVTMVADTIEDQIKLYRGLEHHWKSKGYEVKVIKDGNNRTAIIEKMGKQKP